MIGILTVIAVMLLVFYLIKSWVNIQKIKVAEEQFMNNILKKIRLKKKPTDIITLIEFLNLPPRTTLKILNTMMERGVICIDGSTVSISEFGKYYFDRFIKRK